MLERPTSSFARAMRARCGLCIIEVLEGALAGQELCIDVVCMQLNARNVIYYLTHFFSFFFFLMWRIWDFGALQQFV